MSCVSLERPVDLLPFAVGKGTRRAKVGLSDSRERVDARPTIRVVRREWHHLTTLR